MNWPTVSPSSLGGMWIVALLVTVGAASTSASGEAREDAFLAENRVAMSRMMAGMEVKPSGDVDTDFTAMMIAHHQGAIDMALAELRHGRNEQLRRIAQGIVVEQQQEISAMRLALGQASVLPVAAAGKSPPVKAKASMAHQAMEMSNP